MRHGGTVQRRIREAAAGASAEGREKIPSSHSSFRPTPARPAAHPGNSDYFRVIPSNSDHRKKPPHPFHGGTSCAGGPVRRSVQPQKSPLFTRILTALRVKTLGRVSDAPPPPLHHSITPPLHLTWRILRAALQFVRPMMTENASNRGENTAGGIKKGGRRCGIRPPNNQTNQPLSLNDPGGKTKNPPSSSVRPKYMTPKVMQMFNFIFNPRLPAFRPWFSTPIIPSSAPHAHC